MTDDQLKRRREICEDLLIVIDEDNSIAEEIIDDYVAKCDELELDYLNNLIAHHFGDEL
tara:strand:- start:253 stop:429 length:177 start_codon:yes stop_codon:yes gene_type:complete